MSSQVKEYAATPPRPFGAASRPLNLSTVEILAALSVVAFMAALTGYYFVSVRPEQERLTRLEGELAAQQNLIVAGSKPVEETESETDVARQALDSLAIFKQQHLKPISIGRIAVLNEINALSKSNNVRLVSGIEVKAEGVPALIDQRTAGRPREGGLVFPKLKINFSVQGGYKNLREFISALENSGQFLILDTVDLTSQDEVAPGRRQASGGITLSIALSAYYEPLDLTTG